MAHKDIPGLHDLELPPSTVIAVSEDAERAQHPGTTHHSGYKGSLISCLRTQEQGQASKVSNLSCPDVTLADPAEKSGRPVCRRTHEELNLSPLGLEERAQAYHCVVIMI